MNIHFWFFDEIGSIGFLVCAIYQSFILLNESIVLGILTRWPKET